MTFRAHLNATGGPVYRLRAAGRAHQICCTSRCWTNPHKPHALCCRVNGKPTTQQGVGLRIRIGQLQQHVGRQPSVSCTCSWDCACRCEWTCSSEGCRAGRCQSETSHLHIDGKWRAELVQVMQRVCNAAGFCSLSRV